MPVGQAVTARIFMGSHGKFGWGNKIAPRGGLAKGAEAKWDPDCALLKGWTRGERFCGLNRDKWGKQG